MSSGEKKVGRLLRVVSCWVEHTVTVSPFVSLGFHICQSGHDR